MIKNRKIIIIFLLIINCFIFLTNCTSINPKIKDAKACSEINDNGIALNNINTFSTNDKTIYVSAKTTDIIENTKITIIWYYSSDDNKKEEIYKSSIILNKSEYIKSQLTVPGSLRKGYYYVQFFINNRKSADKTVKVTVK